MILLLEDFCDNNNIDLKLYELHNVKISPIVILKDDFGIEVGSIKGNITRQKLKDLYNEALD